MASRRSLYPAGMFLLASAVLRCETIYSNFGVLGADGTGGGYLLGSIGLGYPPPFSSGFFGVAVPFVPTGNYTLDTIRIPITAQATSPQNQFTVELYDGATEPTTVLERFSVALSGFSVVNLASGLHPVLGAGKQYWVVVLTDGGGQWGWGGLVHPQGTVLTRNTQDSSWQQTPAPSSVPGLDVSGTPATVAVPPAQFGGSLPQVVSGGGWQTTFILVNTGTAPASVQLGFFDDTGSPLSMTLVSPQSGDSMIASSIATTASSIAETIPGGASITVTAPDTGGLRQGSALLTSTGNVGVLAIIRSNPSGQEVGLPLETRNANSYVLAFDNTGNARTGVAIANPSAIPVNIPLAICDESGARLRSTTVSLPAHGHTSFDTYALTGGTRGTMQFDTPSFGRISIVGLRSAPAASGGGSSLTAIPVLTR